MRTVLLPEVSKTIVDDSAPIEDLLSFDITLDDVLVAFVSHFPGIHAEGEEDFRDVAEKIVIDMAHTNEEVSCEDMDVLVYLLQEILFSLYPSFKRMLRYKQPDEDWQVKCILKNMIVVEVL